MKEDDRNTNEKYANCNGLRYAIPYETRSSPIYIKDRFVGHSLDFVLGSMFRRNRGMQPIEEAIEHWSSEIDSGRVEIRGRKLSKDDPWEFYRATAKKIIEKGSSVRLQQHVHEKVVPMMENKINVLFENEEWISINKPPGLATIDEQGGCGINSLMTMVGEQLSLSRNNNETNYDGIQKRKLKLTPAHRLDKPVSGVLIIGKSPKKAAKILRVLHQATKGLKETNGVQKVYLARVYRNPESMALVKSQRKASEITKNDLDEVIINDSSIFPDEIITVEAELGWDNRTKRAIVRNDFGTKAAMDRAVARKNSLDGNIKRSARKRKKMNDMHNNFTDNSDKVMASTTITRDNNNNISKSNQKNKANDNDKAATTTHTTRFRRLTQQQFDDGTVLVECRPLTGQRHQIRAHLAAIGWPIANDIPYGGTSAFRNNNNKSLCAYVDDETHTLQRMLSPSIVSWCNKCKWTMQMLSPKVVGGENNDDDDDDNTEASSLLCLENKNIAEKKENEITNQKTSNNDDILPPLQIDSDGIWLHSLRYVIPPIGLDISAPLPPWAQSVS